MKKFLLLAGVALATLSANKAVAVNVVDDFVTVEAKAKVVLATQRTCTNLNFGKLLIKPDGSRATLRLNADGTTEINNIGSAGILNVTGAAAANCSSWTPQGGIQLPASLTLSNSDGSKTLTVDNFGFGRTYVNNDNYKIGATLTIGNTSEVTSGTYTGSFTLGTTY